MPIIFRYNTFNNDLSVNYKLSWSSNKVFNIKKFSKAKRDRELERLVAFEPSYTQPQTFANFLRFERRKSQAEVFQARFKIILRGL